MKKPRPHPEMYEGQEAFDRFQDAVKTILKVPKAAMPVSPFTQHQTQKPQAPKG